MKYQLVVKYSEKPRIMWPIWDVCWIALESFWAGMSFVKQNWWMFGVCLVFVIVFGTMLVFHLQTMEFLNWEIRRPLDEEVTVEQANQ